MSDIFGYPTRKFSETQKFFVVDPSTQTTSLVLGKDLVNYITPNIDSVKTETTRDAALNVDYSTGTFIATAGGSDIGDGGGGLYLVVSVGQGDYPMLNGNELLGITGTEAEFSIAELDVDGSSDYIVSGANLNAAGYTLTGTLTDNIDVVVPDYRRFYFVSNQTSGDFTVTFRTQNGTGLVAPRDDAWFKSDGANIVAVTEAYPSTVESVSDLRASSFPANLERLWLSGYYGVGTQGARNLYRVGGGFTSSDDNGFTEFVDADGVKWATVTDGGYYAVWAGVSPDNSGAENKEAYDRISDFFGDDDKATLYLCDQDTQIDGTFNVPRHLTLIGKNVKIDASGSEASFDNDAVVNVQGGEPSQTADLSSNVAAGDVTLTFSTDHDFEEGDTGLIWNPTDSSYAFRATYRDGEFFRVLKVVSSTEIQIDRPLYTGYVAGDVSIYTLKSMASANYVGFEGVAPGASTSNGIVRGFRLELSEKCNLFQVKASNSDNASASFSRCFDIIGLQLRCSQTTEDPGFSTQYGLVMGNCQNISVSGFFEGFRHATATGAGDVIGPICREIHVHDSILVKAETTATIAAGDWHGNTEWSSYVRCQATNGGFNLAGNNNKIIDCSARVSKIAVYARELYGCDHEITNFKAYVSDDPDVDLRSIFDIGGDSDPLQSETRLGGIFRFTSIAVKAPNANGNAIAIRNRGFSGSYGLVADGFKLDAPNVSNVVRENTVSGDAPEKMQSTNIESLSSVNPIDIESSSVLVRQSPAFGTIIGQSITSGDSSEEVSVSFLNDFAKSPSVVSSVNSNNARADGNISWPTDVTKSGFNFQFAPSDGGTFPSSRTVDGSWQAQLWEW